MRWSSPSGNGDGDGAAVIFFSSSFICTTTYISPSLNHFLLLRTQHIFYICKELRSFPHILIPSQHRHNSQWQGALVSLLVAQAASSQWRTSRLTWQRKFFFLFFWDRSTNGKKIDWPYIVDKNRRFRLLNMRLESVWTHLFSIRLYFCR